MIARSTNLLVACLLALAPLACTAEDQGATDEQGAGQAGGSNAASATPTDGATDAAISGGTGAGNGDASAEAVHERIRAKLRERRPDIDIASVRETPVEGIHEVVSSGQVYYITPDARYLLSGNLIDLRSRTNLTRQRRAALAHEAVAELDRDSMVVFEPANGPAETHMTVFTDPSCPYCRRLHEEVLQLVEEYPLEVRYAMYPRAGPDSSAADTMRDIWCADDPARAMTAAKAGRSVPQRAPDCDTPMDRHWQVAQRVGVRGTPFLILGDDGRVVSGYRPRQQLVQMLGLAEPSASDR